MASAVASAPGEACATRRGGASAGSITVVSFATLGVEHGAESKLTGAAAPLFLVTFDADGENGAEGTVPPDDDICSKISITLRLRSNTEIFVPFSLLLAMPNVVLQFLCQDNGEGLTKSSSVSSSFASYLPFFANDETTLTTFLAKLYENLHH